MTATHEYRVNTLANRIGLQLARMPGDGGTRLYRLVESGSMTPILPSGGEDGIVLDEIEEWLRFPWLRFPRGVSHGHTATN